VTALQFAVLVWGSLALVAVVFLYELLTVWRDWKETAAESS
jgi:ABC-type multidrug transport system permease subunit